MASGILVPLIPQLGIKPTPPALVARGLNYWITREAPLGKFLNFLSLGFLILKSRIIESGSCAPFRSSGAGQLREEFMQNLKLWKLIAQPSVTRKSFGISQLPQGGSVPQFEDD